MPRLYEKKGSYDTKPWSRVMMEEKTRQILAGSSDDRDPLWHRVAEKLAEVGLASYAPVIGRILGREVGAWAVQIVFGMDKGVFI